MDDKNRESLYRKTTVRFGAGAVMQPYIVKNYAGRSIVGGGCVTRVIGRFEYKDVEHLRIDDWIR